MLLGELWPLSWLVMAGAVPGVVIGGLVRINWLADVRPFKLFVALVLLGIGLEMIRDLFGWMRFKPAPKYEQSPPKPYVEVVEQNLSRVSYTFDGYLYSFSVPILLFYSIAVGLVGGIYGIGGERIFRDLLPRADRLLLTEIDMDVDAADAFFPDFDPAGWQETDRFAFPGDGPAATLRELLARRP